MAANEVITVPKSSLEEIHRRIVEARQLAEALRLALGGCRLPDDAAAALGALALKVTHGIEDVEDRLDVAEAA